MKNYISHSPEQTEQIAAEFASTLKSGDVIAYKGPMGAGKTAFTRGLCRGLGLDDPVSSPTFALVHQYGNGEHALYHFDMYRVESYEDLYSTGFLIIWTTEASLPSNGAKTSRRSFRQTPSPLPSKRMKTTPTCAGFKLTDPK